MNPDLIDARRALLDAPEALGEHREAVVLVGAQAIYLRVGDADLAVEPYTRDGDVALDPSRLKEQPSLEEALVGGRFQRDGVQPGRWLAPGGVLIDLMVGRGLGWPRPTRSTTSRPHGKNTARKARGLEASLVDNDVKNIASFDDTDRRSFDIRVAGEAALLVAKLHKIHERTDAGNRTILKDALDILRILRGTNTADLATSLKHLEEQSLSAEVTREARRYLEELFESTDSPGSRMAAEAVGILEDPDEIAASCATLAGDLLRQLAHG